MEPQFKDCGNMRNASRLPVTEVLQWSRSSKTAETRETALKLNGAFLASMEPQFKDCGNCDEAQGT